MDFFFKFFENFFGTKTKEVQPTPVVDIDIVDIIETTVEELTDNELYKPYTKSASTLFKIVEACCHKIKHLILMNHSIEYMYFELHSNDKNSTINIVSANVLKIRPKTNKSGFTSYDLKYGGNYCITQFWVDFTKYVHGGTIYDSWIMKTKDMLDEQMKALKPIVTIKSI